MREIKFRAWSPSKKLWREDWVMDSYEKIIDLNKERYDDDLILCQYTGLKDKNGKEIWEGDVCRLSMISGGEWVTENLHNVVEFSRCSFVFSVGQRTIPLEWRWDKDTYRVEIIGNIYENPELLEEK